MLCTHKTTILCQFGLFCHQLTTISPSILNHFWWELYQWKYSSFLPLLCVRTLVTYILGLPKIILEDGVVTKLEWQLETRFVSEEELGTENGVSVSFLCLGLGWMNLNHCTGISCSLVDVTDLFKTCSPGSGGYWDTREWERLV